MPVRLKQPVRYALLLPFMLWVAQSAPLKAADLGDSLDVVSTTNRSASQSQEKIDALDRETRILLEEYRSLRESSDSRKPESSYAAGVGWEAN